ncbi:hypothetical protein, partial [Desulfosporosinus sp. OT]|uniref:hypothetical protein n=1 Tax=Desulfosporosinus sp. OT TaxID=913865 RepID=UPI001A99544A
PFGSTLQENLFRDAVWRKAPFAMKCFIGVGGSAILILQRDKYVKGYALSAIVSTGHYRAFGFRA